jgi:rubrerythrin
LLEKARQHWNDLMRVEYESASVFVDLATQVREIHATLDVQVVILRMAQDELRHAALCARVAEALGAEACILEPTPRHATLHPDCSAEESVLRNVIYACCLSEMVNVARFAKRISETTEPFIRDALRSLLADERLHAQFGFFYLESRRPWLDAHPEVRDALTRYLRYAFGILEADMGTVPIGARPPSDTERAIGLPDLTALSTTLEETILNASAPGLERFGIDATAAWRRRGQL